jgi:hypothetical protein
MSKNHYAYTCEMECLHGVVKKAKAAFLLLQNFEKAEQSGRWWVAFCKLQKTVLAAAIVKSSANIVLASRAFGRLPSQCSIYVFFSLPNLAKIMFKTLHTTSLPFRMF